jgi:hypothetical protein
VVVLTTLPYQEDTVNNMAVTTSPAINRSNTAAHRKAITVPRVEPTIHKASNLTAASNTAATTAVLPANNTLHTTPVMVSNLRREATADSILRLSRDMASRSKADMEVSLGMISRVDMVSRADISLMDNREDIRGSSSRRRLILGGDKCDVVVWTEHLGDSDVFALQMIVWSSLSIFELDVYASRQWCFPVH